MYRPTDPRARRGLPVGGAYYYGSSSRGSGGSGGCAARTASLLLLITLLLGALTLQKVLMCDVEEDAAAEVRSRWVGCWWVRARAPYGRRASSDASELLLNPMRRRKERGEETRTAHPLSLIHLTPRLSRQANLGNSSLVEIRRREKQRIRAAAKARADALKKLKEEEDRKFASDDVSRRGQGVAHRG